MRIKRILVPTDLSEASMPAVKLAADFGKAFRAELLLLFVVEPLHTSGDILSAGELAAVVEAHDKAARTRLAREVARLGKRGVRARGNIGEGSAAAVIVESARKSSADLIVIATHGRTGFSRVLMGSVAERVVRTAGCPVLTVRSRARQTTREAPNRHRGQRRSAPGLRAPSTTTLI